MTDRPEIDPPEGATVFLLGQRLPSPLAETIAMAGSTGLANLPDQLFIASLADYRPEDAREFERPAQFRVGLCRSFIVLSLSLPGLNFDLFWSPLIARETGEPRMPRPDPSQHLLFNFLLVDGHQVVRAIRQATISPECATAIWRAQGELSQRALTPAIFHGELTELMARYPRSIDPDFFHAICNLGD